MGGGKTRDFHRNHYFLLQRIRAGASRQAADFTGGTLCLGDRRFIIHALLLIPVDQLLRSNYCRVVLAAGVDFLPG